MDSVADQDAILLKRLKAHGISPGMRIQVTKRSPQEFSLLTGSPLRVLRLSRALAEAVRVRSAE